MHVFMLFFFTEAVACPGLSFGKALAGSSSLNATHQLSPSRELLDGGMSECLSIYTQKPSVLMANAPTKKQKNFTTRCSSSSNSSETISTSALFYVKNRFCY
jgi:hypothetical protein